MSADYRIKTGGPKVDHPRSLLSVWGFFREREKWLHICNHLGEQKFWSAAEHFSVHMARESSESIDTGPEP